MDFDDLLIGLELEFTAIHSKKFLMKELKEKFSIQFSGKKDIKWSIEGDHSITPSLRSHYAYELISPPLSYKIALQYINDISDFFEQHDCRTNNTTGLHVNMNFKDKALNQKIDPVKLILFTPENMLKKYRRQRNVYCKPYSSTLNEWAKVLKPRKNITYRDVVNFFLYKLKFESENFRIVNVNKLFKSNYAEFRIIGNKNYHLRLDEIKNDIEKMSEALCISASPILHLHEYKEKLSSYIVKNAKDYK